MFFNFKIYQLALFSAFFILGCGACNKGEIDEIVEEENPITWEECGYNQGDHMCDFSLVDQNGDHFDLYDHIGDPIILDYSSMWCGYCQVAAGSVTSVQDYYADHDLLYVTILIENIMGTPPTVEDCDSWASVFGIIDSPVLAGDRNLIDGSGENGVPVSGWPTFLFLDDEMVIRTVLRGYSETSLHQGIHSITTD